jgi:hypothetical protein
MAMLYGRMFGLTREDIMQCLTDRKNGENSRKLLAFCREPKTMSEMGKAGVRGDLFKVLVDLKKADALAFADGKYFATPLALEVLKSLQ